MKNSIKRWIFLLPFVLLAGCGIIPKKLPPKRLYGKSIELYFTKITQPKQQMINKTLLIHFYPNLIYKSYLEGSFFQEGNYAYNRVDRSSGEVQIDVQLFAESRMSLIQFIFTAPEKGLFYAADIKGAEGGAQGTFTLLSPPKIDEQNEAYLKEEVFSDETLQSFCEPLERST